MKLKIKVKILSNGIMPLINENGDWIDLYAADNVCITAAQSGVLKRKKDDSYRNISMPVCYIPLGVAMELPKGFEAIVASRSSTPKNKKLFIPSGQGIIDNIYNGDDDQWYFVCSPMEETTINTGDKICQFRIQLSQKATFWQKLKWLFSSGIELVKVDELNNKNRGGLGSTGK